MGHNAAIGVSPQFSVHHAAKNQILLLSEKRSFRLSGDLYLHLLPYLNGAYDEEEIVAALADRAPREEVVKALNHMGERGYIRSYGKAPTAQQSLWIEWEEDPQAVSAALSAWPLTVRALGQTRAANDGAAAALRETLADTGFPMVGPGDARLVVVLVDDLLQPDLAAVNAEVRRAGQAWIALKPGGREAWISPRFDAEGSRCWLCLSRWLGEHRPGDNLIADPSRAPRPARGMLRATLEFARAQASLALTRMATGERELEDHLLSFDSRSGGLERHYVRVDPCCSVCGSAEGGKTHRVQVPALPNFTQEGGIAHQDGGWRVLNTEEARKRLSRLISPITGVVPGLEDHSERLGLPVVSARQSTPRAVNLAANRVLGRPSAAAGKGTSVAQAEVSCLAEALERYCTTYTGRETRRRATMAELGETAIDPRGALQFSDRQYRDREAWNQVNDVFNQVPEPFDPEERIEWSPIYRLRDGAERWIPTRYAYFHYIDAENRKARNFCLPDSNGCASGAVLSEAVLQGVLELVERDAFGLFWYNRARRPAIDLDSFDDPALQGLRASYREMGRSLYALDLRTDLGIPVVAALSADAEGGKIFIGLGAHLDASIAVSRAVTEVNQIAVLLDSAAEDPEADSVMARWYRGATLENQPYLVPLEGQATGAADFPQLSERGILPGLEAAVGALERAGLEPLAMDLTWPDLDLAAARVVVPGLRHFWARFAPGRLYDLPVSLGWIDRPTAEENLNPIPFFL